MPAGRRLGFALISLGVASSCTKSVDIIGFGPLETETPPVTTSPPTGIEAGVPTPAQDASDMPPASDGSAQPDASILPDASVPPDPSALPDASVLPDATVPVAPEAGADDEDAAVTTVQGPFGAVAPLADFLGADDPSFTADGLEMYLDVNDSDRIHVASRAAPDEPFGEPIPLDAVGDDANGKTPWITPDGLQLYFGADREGGAGLSDIWWIERRDRESPWGPAQPLSEVNSTLEEFAPSLSADGLLLILTRANIGLGGQELWLADRATVDAPWNAPTLMAINDPNRKDSDAVFSPDALEVWWVRAVSDDDEDLFFSRRATRDDPFTTPTPAAELNSPFPEGDPWLSADGREIVFFSTRTGDRMLYRATR